ncbi:hypothetical protein L1887_08135 [Cichorium endivia]|nr:hypothetical protein L1887_08135 [Cichorium endivia]
MGKLPPSLRTGKNLGLPIRSLITNVQQSPRESELESQSSPHHSRRKHKSITKKPNTSMTTATSHPSSPPPISFTSPDISTAKTLFNSVATTTKYSSLLNNRFCNAVLQSFSSVSSNVQDSINLLNHMTKTHPSFTPDKSSYHILLCQSCKKPDLDLANVNKTLHFMASKGFEPDKVTTDIAIRTLCSTGHEEHAIELIKKLSQGNALGALELLGEMENKGCSPNECTYNTLLLGLCKARHLDKGVELYEVMKENDMKLESGSYGTFLRALCRNGKVAEAYEVFDYAIESNSLTDVAAYSTLESTLKWLKKAKEQGLAV